MIKPNIIRAQGTAFNLLQRYAQLEAAPVEVEAISLGEGMDFEIAPLAGCAARLVRYSRNSGFARISSKISEPGRVRFTLAHELGHFMMHVGQSQVKACSNGDMTDYRRNPLEIEANIFAGEILMPRANFQNKAKQTGPTFHEISDLATLFNVSLTAAAIRYIDIGPYEFMTLVCFDRSKRVQWSKSRSGNGSLWVNPGTLAPAASMAECAFKSRSNVDSTEIHPSVWSSSNVNDTMTEECLFMAEYGYVLSLLCLEPC